MVLDQEQQTYAGFNLDTNWIINAKDSCVSTKMTLTATPHTDWASLGPVTATSLDQTRRLYQSLVLKFTDVNAFDTSVQYDGFAADTPCAGVLAYERDPTVSDSEACEARGITVDDATLTLKIPSMPTDLGICVLKGKVYGANRAGFLSLEAATISVDVMVGECDMNQFEVNTGL